MRKTLLVVALAGGLAGCGLFRKPIRIDDSTPAHTPATSTSIYGDWVLASPDSTAFVGASVVEMKLEPTRFMITAKYPSRPVVTIRGSVAQAESGALVTLQPESGLEPIGSGNFVWPPGERVTIVASAADNTLVFAPPRDMAARPSSVWHRKAAALKAGTVRPPTS